MSAPLKSATTSVTVEKSQQAIVVLLRKFGAREFGFDEDSAAQVASVRFMYPTGAEQMLPVRIDVEVTRVYERLYPASTITRGYLRYVTDAQRQARRAQSHRTAWRLLYDWLDAALNTVAMGAQTAEDVFLAHAFVRVADGSMVRVKDYTAGALYGGTLPMLGSGA
jgi:hypothetical protein